MQLFMSSDNPADHEESKSRIRAFADEGNALAQAWIGLALADGEFTYEKNETEAINWLTKAARGGSVHAQNKLGFMLSQGLGIKKNPERARSVSYTHLTLPTKA